VFEIRRVLTHVEDIFHEFGPAPEKPLRRGAIAAVMTNPFAGRYEPKIEHAMEALKPIGFDMAQRLLAAMAVAHASIEGYGKGAIVGARGELEHGALWHVPGGYAMRELLEKNGVPTNAIVPSTKKVGAPSSALDVPLTHGNASYVAQPLRRDRSARARRARSRRSGLHPRDEHRAARACARRRARQRGDRGQGRLALKTR